MASDRIFNKVNAADFGFLPNAGGKENARALSKAVESAAFVSVDKSGVYDISGSVKLPSDTHLEFSQGVILRRVPLENRNLEGNLFVNEGAFDGRYNENISIKGAHISVNGVESAGASPESVNVIAGLRGHIAFLYIRNLLLEDIVITDLMKKDYGIQISDFENAEVRRVHIEGLKDGVHFGPGKGFAVRDSVFCTYDDAIALNCADYSVSNPNFGSISDGIIENCRELDGYKTEAFFIRILVGTARRWQKGMIVYHSDAILTGKGMYRVVMRPDNTAYISVTEPDFEDGYKELDGIMWVRTHKGYEPQDLSLTAGCKNIICRNITVEPQRRRGVYIYTSFDEYLRSYYYGSEVPEVSDITFDNIKLIKPAEHFIAVNTKVGNLKITNSSVDETDILYEKNCQMQEKIMRKLEITDEELGERIALNHRRMSEPFYDIDNVFAPVEAAWPGDKEGRALLAFVSLIRAGREKIPCMELMINALPSKLNEKGYLGPVKEEFFEQQLSGHSWLLRGLCEYYEKYEKSEILSIINGITENLYLPLKGKIRDYPLARKGENNGGVDGHTALEEDGWLLSTDTCCAFMSIDGLSHAYKLTGDERIAGLLDEMIETFMKIDKRKIKAQTHCTLTAARGMIRLYHLTGNEKYLENARFIFRIYVDYGMTYTYENYNWWGRPETWTEPCAVIDSLMLASELYKITGDAQYRTLAARIYHNGFATLQRCNGGAGTQKIVCETRDILQISGFEAKQCCTMRLAEGLRYILENREILYAEISGNVSKDEKGIYRDGDIIYAETVGNEKSGLHPLIKYYKLTEDEIMNTKQKIVFKED